MMLMLAAVLLVGVLVLAGLLLAWSPGRLEPFRDENGRLLAGSISEKIFVNINGAEQGMLIRSRDTANPVLLYLHGGMPEYFLAQKYPTGLEDHFTVVWWERRGSGISYRPGTPVKDLTLEQFIADTREVANYLRQRFGKDKIYLMGHSGGTFVGIQTAQRAPELFHAYIGMAQMSHQLKSERLAYEYMLARFREQGNRGMVRRLEAAPVTMDGGTPAGYLALRDPAMHPLGIGTTHDMSSHITGVFLQSFTCRAYTLTEKVNLWRAKSQAGVSILWDDILATDLSQRVTQLETPVYFIHGRYDYTVSYVLAREYLAKIRAPVKGFYTFDQSAHSPLFEEPEKMNRILLEDVLAGRNSLADVR
jgi:pimeloyl-ACP methyl ester carboxylesterase